MGRQPTGRRKYKRRATRRHAACLDDSATARGKLVSHLRLKIKQKKKKKFYLWMHNKALVRERDLQKKGRMRTSKIPGHSEKDGKGEKERGSKNKNSKRPAQPKKRAV